MTANGYRHHHVRDELIEDQERDRRWRVRGRAVVFAAIVVCCLAIDVAAIRLIFHLV